MQFGPFSETDVNVLKAALDKEGRNLRVAVSKDEIETADLLSVRGLLEKTGHQVGTYKVSEVSHEPEVLCPHCKFSSGAK